MQWTLLLLGIYLGFCFLLATRYTRPMRDSAIAMKGGRELAVDPRDPARDLEVARQSPEIPIYHFEAEDPRGGFVLAHGYGGLPNDWQEVALDLQSRGYTVVVPAMPAHTNSPEETVGFGKKEADTVIACAEWLRKRHPNLPIAAHGISLGGAACWMASAKRPDLFTGIGSDGSFPNLDEGSRRYLSAALPGSDLLLFPVIPLASLFVGVKPSEIRPEDDAKKWKGKPALVIHGDADRMFPLAYGERLAQSAGTKLWVIPGGRHAGSMEIGITAYVDRLETLLDQP